MNRVIHGDALEEIQKLPNSSVDLVFTSPPYYNAKDYVYYESYEEYLVEISTTLDSLSDKLDEGRFMIVNTSPVIQPRKNRASQSIRYGIPFDLHARLMATGNWLFIDDIIWRKPEASAKNRVSGFNRHRKPMTYKPNVCTEYLMVYRNLTSRLIDWNLKQYDSDTMQNSLVQDDIERSNVWDIAPTMDSVHPAVFPEKLVDTIVRYYSYIGDTILDPYAGSGTVGVVAKKNNRNYVLIESNDIYVDRIKARLGA